MTTPTEPSQARPRTTRWRRSSRRLTSLVMVLAVLVAVTAVTVTHGPPAGASTPPPWEPDAVNEAGTLTFYDASGHVITTGSTANPIAAYIKGSAGIRTGDTKAVLYAYTPVNGVAVGAWTGEALSPSTPYGTGVTYPGDLAGTALPVMTGNSGDETLAAYIADVPNNDSSADGYAGIYQLRLKTTQPGQSVTTKWDAADVVVSGSTWTQVFPTPAAATVPGAPTGVSGVAGNGSVQVSWLAPGSTGGSPITGYSVASSPVVSPPAGCTLVLALTCDFTGLTNGTAYTFKVTATNAIGTGPASSASAPVTPAVPAGAYFHALTPARVLDSRPGPGNTGGYTSPWTAGTVRTVTVGGHGGVPANADSVVLNVTVADTTSSSYLSVWPTGQSQPTASSLNWTAGEVIPNAVTVKLGSSGQISVFNQAGSADVIIDVAGYYDANTGDGFSSLTPARVLDSRPGPGNTGGYTSPWTTGTIRTVNVGSHGGVPPDADAVVLNVTVADTTGSSYLSVWPTGQSQPTASSLNWVAAEVIPNAVTVKLGSSGQISVFNNSGNADVIVDVAGYYKAGTGKLFHSLAPARILDSRPGPGNTGGYSSPWGPTTLRTVAVGGLVGVPATADSVVMNVTVADTTGSSFLTLWPNGQTQPTASNLNWVPGEVVPNAVTVKLGTTGHLSIANFAGNVDVIADVAGYFN